MKPDSHFVSGISRVKYKIPLFFLNKKRAKTTKVTVHPPPWGLIKGRDRTRAGGYGEPCLEHGRQKGGWLSDGTWVPRGESKNLTTI